MRPQVDGSLDTWGTRDHLDPQALSWNVIMYQHTAQHTSLVDDLFVQNPILRRISFCRSVYCGYDEARLDLDCSFHFPSRYYPMINGPTQIVCLRLFAVTRSAYNMFLGPFHHLNGCPTQQFQEVYCDFFGCFLWSPLWKKNTCDYPSARSHRNGGLGTRANTMPSFGWNIGHDLLTITLSIINNCQPSSII